MTCTLVMVVEICKINRDTLITSNIIQFKIHGFQCYEINVLDLTTDLVSTLFFLRIIPSPQTYDYVL